MSKKKRIEELEKRIDELEREVEWLKAALAARPYYPYSWYPWYPGGYEITCNDTYGGAAAALQRYLDNGIIMVDASQ